MIRRILKVPFVIKTQFAFQVEVVVGRPHQPSTEPIGEPPVRRTAAKKALSAPRKPKSG